MNDGVNNMNIIEFVQSFVLLVLAFCLIFGIGFIINMLMKTTWFPIYSYAVVVVALIVIYWGSDYVAGFSFADSITLLSGLGGAVVSGLTIRTLRSKGYKMF
jgi:hypothetical protein